VKPETFLDGRVQLYRGDCLAVLPTLEENSIDSCVTDPPYHLTSIVKRFGAENSAPCQVGKTGAYARASKGFMGKQWDGGDIAFRPELWAEVLRVLKPGAHLLAFSGTRTYHRMACAIEDAGFEIRDQIGWCYGSGFPKSHDISKAIDRMAGAEREVIGSYRAATQTNNIGTSFNASAADEFGRTEAKITLPATEAAKQWAGYGTSLKPAWEPIVLARKPLSESSIASNVLKHGTGAINIDGCRIEAAADDYAHPGNGLGKRDDETSWRFEKRQVEPNKLGRWPANLIHDGSEEVLEGFPETLPCGSASKVGRENGAFGLGRAAGFNAAYVGDSGSAARFFYTAKADADDRLGSKHPTVKPLDLISYLAKLITPRDGLILDPFAGTGTCGEAAFRNGFRAILIEREPEYQADIVKRMGLCLAGPDERRAASVKQESVDDLPMFAGRG
jgi:DNA modification methylase